jgi:DnaJ family protein A protein 2
MEEDYYKILEVPRGASQEDIKQAQRRLAKIWHPDKNKSPEANAKFQKINEAYETLGNPEKRELYDRFGKEGLNNSPGINPMDPMSMFSGIFGRSPFGMGGFGQPEKMQRGPDKLMKIQVSLIEMMNGAHRQVDIKRICKCSECYGSGSKSGLGGSSCRECNGSGRKTIIRQMGPGMMAQQSMPCNKCSGSGKYIEEKDLCRKCRGNKTEDKMEKVEFDIPMGVKNGETVVIEGKSDWIPDKMDGDSEVGNLIVQFFEEQSKEYKRIGNDYYITHRILLSEALFGLEKKFNHPNGRIIILRFSGKTIQPGETFIVKGFGFPTKNGEIGNMIIEIEVKLPDISSENASKIMKKILPLRKELTKEELGKLETVELERINKEMFHKEPEYEEEDNGGGAPVECVHQ